MDIVEQLVRIYETEDYYQRGALTDLEARRYYSKMLGHGRIQTITDGLNVEGFIESWRLTPEQLGRVVCWSEFSALEEDVQDGEVAYVADIWVRGDKRKEGLCDELVKMFWDKNKDADYFVSTRVKNKGKTKYIRVYDKANGYKYN